MKFTSLFNRFNEMNKAINETDGRSTVVSVVEYTPSPEELQARAEHAKKAELAKEYLNSRNKNAYTNDNFNYVPAESTDIRVAMREFVAETMPHLTETYKFLF